MVRDDRTGRTPKSGNRVRALPNTRPASGDIGGHVRALPWVATLVLTVACLRDPDDGLCPDVVAGDLVVTEIRGEQDQLDTIGQWIELANRSGTALDLLGLGLELYDLSGKSANPDRRVLVRDVLEVPPDDYVVLGHHEPARQPAFVDYSFFEDYRAAPSEDGVPIQATKDLPTNGTLVIVACGVEIDRVRFALPTAGTRSLDGAIEPTAEVNDPEANWCDDVEPSADGSTGLFGTPGAANRVCLR